MDKAASRRGGTYLVQAPGGDEHRLVLVLLKVPRLHRARLEGGLRHAV